MNAFPTRPLAGVLFSLAIACSIGCGRPWVNHFTNGTARYPANSRSADDTLSMGLTGTDTFSTNSKESPDNSVQNVVTNDPWKSNVDTPAGANARTAARPESDPPGLQTQLERGQMAEDEGRLAEAKLHYEAVLQLRPQHVTANHRLAIIADKEKRFADAERHYRVALKEKPNDANLLSDIGYSLFLQERWDESEATLRSAIAAQPNHRTALNNLGYLYGRRAQMTGSIEDYSRAYAQFRVAGTEEQAQLNIRRLFPNGPPTGQPSNLAQTPTGQNPTGSPGSQQSPQLPNTSSPNATPFGEQPLLPNPFQAQQTNAERPENPFRDDVQTTQFGAPAPINTRQMPENPFAGTQAGQQGPASVNQPQAQYPPQYPPSQNSPQYPQGAVAGQGVAQPGMPTVAGTQPVPSQASGQVPLDRLREEMARIDRESAANMPNPNSPPSAMQPYGTPMQNGLQPQFSSGNSVAGNERYAPGTLPAGVGQYGREPFGDSPATARYGDELRQNETGVYGTNNPHVAGNMTAGNMNQNLPPYPTGTGQQSYGGSGTMALNTQGFPQPSMTDAGIPQTGAGVQPTSWDDSRRAAAQIGLSAGQPFPVGNSGRLFQAGYQQSPGSSYQSSPSSVGTMSRSPQLNTPTALPQNGGQNYGSPYNSPNGAQPSAGIGIPNGGQSGVVQAWGQAPSGVAPAGGPATGLSELDQFEAELQQRIRENDRLLQQLQAGQPAGGLNAGRYDNGMGALQPPANNYPVAPSENGAARAIYETPAVNGQNSQYGNRPLGTTQNSGMPTGNW